jgi:hypothetical protein
MNPVLCTYPQDEFCTADLGCAGFLIAHGVSLLGIQPSDGRRQIFRFPSTARNLARGYLRNDLVPARAYFCAVRDLKAMLREA